MKCAPKSIFPAFETIKAVDGVLQHIAYHQARFDKTRQECYGSVDKISLSSLLSPPKELTCRVRVEYTHEVLHVEYIPYVPRKINSFCIVESNLNYAYKWSNREEITALLVEGYDDIIIVKNGLLCDTSIANVAVFMDGAWMTPKEPLLKGVTRQRLIDSGFLQVANLTMQSLQKMEKFAIMNALIGFKIIENVCITRKKD
ncbi:MAG: branched-chain amino acid aminotransferase [Sulfurimonas sp. RIFOXYB2_FULL_37_5]|nr:MAG: branched-chain amino acid aminotransferase [Sulfurimonas sp. RIFOXYB2_FULL_37_5]